MTADISQLCQRGAAGEAEIAFKPQGEGATSLGTRINRRNYFKGAIRQARFTPRA